MPELENVVASIAVAPSWNARVALVRKVPEEYGQAHQGAVYAAIAERVYVPSLAPDFAYINWNEDYELEPLRRAYDAAYELTKGFTQVDIGSLTECLEAQPKTLMIFRLLLGYTTQEFSAATAIISDRMGLPKVGNSRVKAIESGSAVDRSLARCCAFVIDEAMHGRLFPTPPGDVRSKIEKPDTLRGWESVREYALSGVPFPVFLHQRHYGGAFRQLLDATSTLRGDLLENAVEELFKAHNIPHIRTGAHNQEEVRRRFGITVKPAPDFVVFDSTDALRAMLECKAANDGGTARDKAGRYRSLRAEATRLGGVPLFAVLAGLGWKRTGDALGPVIRDTDGRTFTIPTLTQMVTVQPFPSL